MPKEESNPIPLKYIDVTRTTYSSLEVMLEQQIEDYSNVDGEKELSDADRIHDICFTKGKATGRIYMGRGRLTRKQTTSRPDDVWPDMLKFMSDASNKKVKQRWAIEKPKLENARQLRGIFH